MTSLIHVAAYALALALLFAGYFRAERTYLAGVRRIEAAVNDAAGTKRAAANRAANWKG